MKTKPDQDEQLAQQVWTDLRGSVPLDRVQEVTASIAARFDDARIGVFVPIIVRRQARDALQNAARAQNLAAAD